MIGLVVSVDGGDTAAAVGAAEGELRDDDLSALRAEQGRIEVLLSCQGPRLLWFTRPADRARAHRAGVEWTEDLGDPEFTKNLRTLHQLIAGARGICERAYPGYNAGSGEAGGDSVSAGAASPPEPSDRGRRMTSRIDELAERIALPRDRPLTLESLLGHRFDVEQLLIEIGDEKYLRLRAAALYEEGEGTYVRWRDMFGQPPPLLAESGSNAAESERDTATDDRIEATKLMLARLLAAKEAQDLPLRARRELKARVVWLILPLIFAAACLFALALAIVENDVDSVLLAGAAGLAGAALGGLLQLRDEVTRGAQLREFTPFYLGQLLVGATAGLLVYAADRSGVVEIVGGPAGVATVAFAVGFSEAAFLRLLARVGGSQPPGESAGSLTGSERTPPDQR
jgi:hypothetical protein